MYRFYCTAINAWENRLECASGWGLTSYVSTFQSYVSEGNDLQEAGKLSHRNDYTGTAQPVILLRPQCRSPDDDVTTSSFKVLGHPGSSPTQNSFWGCSSRFRGSTNCAKPDRVRGKPGTIRSLLVTSTLRIWKSYWSLHTDVFQKCLSYI